MKFDTPEGANPLDQQKLLGRATDRIDGPLKATGTAKYAYEWHDEVPNAAYGYVIGAAIAKGRIVSIDTHGAKSAPGVIGVLTAADVGPLQKVQFNTAKLLGGPEIQHYHQAIAIVVAETFEQARTAAQRVQVKYARTPGAFDLEAARATAKPQRITGGPPGYRRRRLRGRICSRAGEARRHVHHARPGARDDGAACVHRCLGGRQAHAVDRQPDGLLGQARHGHHARHPPGKRAHHLAVHRRWLRRKTVPARRRAARGAGGTRLEAAGESRAAASTDDQQHRAPPGHHPAHSAGRDSRWQAHGHRTRILVRRSARRQTRGRGAPLAHHVRRGRIA